jgi:hypothetical protein
MGLKGQALLPDDQTPQPPKDPKPEAWPPIKQFLERPNSVEYVSLLVSQNHSHIAAPFQKTTRWSCSSAPDNGNCGRKTEVERRRAVIHILPTNKTIKHEEALLPSPCVI